MMLPQRPDATPIWLSLLLGIGIAALSRGAGFSLAIAVVVGTLTASVGWWAIVTER
jgi:hypothetical protein